MQCFVFFKQMVKNFQCWYLALNRYPCIASFFFNLVSLRAAVGAESKVSSWTSTERASRKDASMLSLSFHMGDTRGQNSQFLIDIKIDM